VTNFGVSLGGFLVALGSVLAVAIVLTVCMCKAAANYETEREEYQHLDYLRNTERDRP
jgi:hypothetical protein